MACFLAKGVQYGTVGFVMGTVGSSLVLGLTSLRTMLDSSYEPPPVYQPVFGTGLGWLLFMSGSSNVRYNLINFIEDFAYERWVARCFMPTSASEKARGLGECARLQCAAGLERAGKAAHNLLLQLQASAEQIDR